MQAFVSENSSSSAVPSSEFTKELNRGFSSKELSKLSSWNVNNLRRAKGVLDMSFSNMKVWYG